MKKSFSMLIIAIALSFGVSCSSDDNDNPGGGGTAVDTTKIDEKATFLDRVVTLDSAGNLLGVNIGASIDPTDATVYSTAATDLAAAKEQFLALVADFKDVKAEGNNIVVQMTSDDSIPQYQGTINFTASNYDTQVAEITFKDFNVPGMSKFTYIKDSAWPDNASSPYTLWQVVNVPILRYNYPQGLVIREYSNGNNGMILCTLNSKTQHEARLSNASKNTMLFFQKTIQLIGVDKVKNRLNQAGMFSDLSEYFWTTTDERKYYEEFQKWYRMRLDNGITNFCLEKDINLSNDNAYNCYCFYFNSQGLCW